jgi:hypothetical protein
MVCSEEMRGRAHPGVVGDEGEAPESKKKGGARDVDVAVVEEMCRSWRVGVLDGVQEVEEGERVPFPCSGSVDGVHGGGDGR